MWISVPPAKKPISNRKIAPDRALTAKASVRVDAPKQKTKNVNFSREILIAAEEKTLELMRADVKSSFSALVEVALLELFKRPDFVSVVQRHGLGLRRD